MSIFDSIGKALKDPDVRDKLIIGLQGMTVKPNQSMMDMAQQNIKDRRDNRALATQSNKTLEFLRAKGTDEATLQSLQDNPQMLMAYTQNILKPSNQPSSIREYEYAKQNGFDGTFEQWSMKKADKAPTAAIQEYNFAKNQGFDGTFEQWSMKKAALQGGGKLTEGEGKSAGFFGRMSASNDVINKFEQDGLDLGQKLAGQVPLVGNFMVSENYQQLKNAQDDFLRALLRKESGAVISDEEISTYGPVYFPQAGDGPQVLEQKRQNRERQINSMKLTSGAGASQLEQMQGGLNQGITRL